MPAIPVRAAGASDNPCARHGCALCCYDTEMPVSDADIRRLESRGHERDAFTVVDAETGEALLRNVTTDAGRHCALLVDGRCSVYEDRPQGCRWYPVILTPALRVTKDEDCPHRAEFPVPADAERRLVGLVAEIERDARARR